VHAGREILAARHQRVDRDMGQEKRQQAQHEHQPERRHVALAAPGEIFQGEEARPGHQRRQGVQHAAVHVEEGLQRVLEHVVHRLEHGVDRLPAVVAELALHGCRAIGAMHAVVRDDVFPAHLDLSPCKRAILA